MNEVFEYLENNVDFEHSSNIVAAISGGPDSMALLNILIKIRDTKNINIICAHVNHNLRKESEDEKNFLKKYCESNNIVFEYLKITNYNNDNFHNQSRKIRYDFFESLIEKYNSKYLFTAHHGDDLIETILMRITRGSSINGYSGFHISSKRKNYCIIRPLIFVTKEELENYDIENNISYVVDKSNFKDCYSRNRYRKYILPFLKNENKNVHKKYLKFSNELYKYESYIEKETTKVFDSIYNKNILNIEKFKLLDDIIQERIIKKILIEKLENELNLINDKHLHLIKNVIFSKKPNTYITLPNNLIVQKEYNDLKFKYNIDAFLEYKILLEDKIKKDDHFFEIVDNSDDTSNYCIRLNSSEIKLPLYIRNKIDGDKIFVKGLDHYKKVKDIFINSKVSLSERRNYPLLVDSNNEILWIPGIKKSKYDKSKNEKYDIIIRYY